MYRRARRRIGKSRLVTALHERIAVEPNLRLRYFCSPNHEDSALHPVIAHMERAAGFTRDDDAEAKYPGRFPLANCL